MPTTYTDNFTDTAGVLLTNHTPDSGGSWSIIIAANQEPFISNANRLRMGTGGATIGFYLYSAIPTSADYTVSTTIRNFTFIGTVVGPIARWDSATNSGYRVLFSSSSGNLILIRRNSGTDTTLATVGAGFGGAVDYNITLELSGANLTVKTNGTTRITHTDTSPILTAGRVGFHFREFTQSDTTGTHIDAWSATFPDTSPTAISVFFDVVNDLVIRKGIISPISTRFDNNTDFNNQLCLPKLGTFGIDIDGTLIIDGVRKLTSPTQFDIIDDLYLNNILQTTSAFTFDIINDCIVDNYRLIPREFGFDAINELAINNNRYIYSPAQFDAINDFSLSNVRGRVSETGFDDVSEFNLGYIRRVGLNTQFDVINTFSLSYVLLSSSTTTAISENFDAITDYIVNGVLKRTSPIGIDVINDFSLSYTLLTTSGILPTNFDGIIDHSVNGVLRRPVVTQFNNINDTIVDGVRTKITTVGFEVVNEFYVNAIRGINRSIAIDAVCDFNSNAIKRIVSVANFECVDDFSLSMYRRTALQAQFSCIVDVESNNIRNQFSTAQFSSNSDYNVNFVIAKLIEFYADCINDTSIDLNIRTALAAPFDSICDFDVTISNSVLSYIYTVEINLTDITDAVFYL